MLASCQALSCRRGGRQLFSDLALTLRAGELIELRGPNGSGKSTLLRALAGLYPDIDGTIELQPASYFGHRLGLSPLLTAPENLAWFSGIDGGDGHTDQLDAALERVGVHAHRQAVGALSAGQQRRVALARLLICPRPVWLLDEPLTALDADGIELVGALITEHRDSGGGVICATHQDLPVTASQRLELGQEFGGSS